MTDTNGANVTAKKRAKKEPNADENKVDEKRQSETPCTVTIDTSPSVSLRKMENLIYGKYCVSGEGGVLVTQEMMMGTDTAKVDMNAKSDAPGASDASQIDTPKINVKIGIVKPYTVAIALSQCVSLIQQVLCDAQSYGEGSDTGSIDANKEAKKRQQKPPQNENPNRSQHLDVCL